MSTFEARLEQLQRISGMVLELSAGDRAAILALLNRGLEPAPVIEAPKPKRGRKPKAIETATELPDYVLPSPYRSKGASPVLAVQFADAQVIRVPVPSLPRKPLNVGRALRVACEFYRARTKCPLVPQIVAANIGDQSIDANAANAHTQTARAIPQAWSMPAWSLPEGWEQRQAERLARTAETVQFMSRPPDSPRNRILARWNAERNVPSGFRAWSQAH